MCYLNISLRKQLKEKGKVVTIDVLLLLRSKSGFLDAVMFA